MTGGGHPAAAASDLMTVGALFLFLGRADRAADVLTALRVAVVSVGTAKPSARGIRCAVFVIAPVQQRSFGEIFVAGIIADDRDSPVLTNFPVNILPVIRRVEEMRLTGEKGNRQLGKVC